MITFLARVWFFVCAALAVLGPVVTWQRFTEFYASRATSRVAGILLHNGFYGSASIVRGILVLGLTLKFVVFTGCAGLLARYGRDRPFPLALAGGVLCYGVGLLLPVDHPPAHFAWVFHVNLSVAASMLALATLTLPDGRFVSRARLVYWIFWVAMVWLVLHPVGLPWRGLHGNTVLRGWIHVALLLGGLRAMGRRHARSGPEGRLQMKWVLLGLGASVAGFAISNALGKDGRGAETFAMVVQPLLQSCAVLAITVAVVKDGLWNLKDILPRFFGGASFVATVLGSTLLLDRLAAHAWSAQGGNLFTAALVSFVLSLVLAWFGRGLLSQLVDVVLFPSAGDRRQAIALGRLALEDVMTEKEVIWAVEGVFEHGWPGSRVEIYRREGHDLVALDDHPFNSSPPIGLKELKLTDGAPGAPDTLWFPLHAQREEVGAVRVIPSSEGGFSTGDLTEITKIVEAVSIAVWRVTQSYRFGARVKPVERHRPHA